MSTPPPAAPPASKTRFQRESEFAQIITTAHEPDTSFARLIDRLRTQLQHALENAEQIAARLECQKEGLYVLRRIAIAWQQYPNIGVPASGDISESDLRYTAFDVVKSYNTGSLPKIIARLVSNAVDPSEAEPEAQLENIIMKQRRIEAVLSAMKQQWKVWQGQMLSEGAFTEESFASDPSTDEAKPINYNYQLSDDNAAGATTANEETNELDDNQSIYVSGGKVLTSKAKMQYAAKVKAEEDGKAKAAAGNPSKKTKFTSTSRKEGSSPAQEDEADESRQEGLGRGIQALAQREKKSAAFDDEGERQSPKKRRRSTVMAGLAKQILSEDKQDEEDEGDAQSRTLPQGDISERTSSAFGGGLSRFWDAPPTRRKHAANTTPSGAGDDEDPQPTKKRRTLPRANTKKSANMAGDYNRSSSPTEVIDKEVDNTMPGGAAKKWLRDEDDWGHNAIIEHPEWPMPQVYRAFNERFANTAYQDGSMNDVDYRSDWIRFPHPHPMKDKATRPFDVCWRSYQSVRQRFEKFKKEVMDPNVQPPYTWTECPENLATHLPKRAPPPRRKFFRDGITPIPPAPGAPAQPMGFATTGLTTGSGSGLISTYQPTLPPLSASTHALTGTMALPATGPAQPRTTSTDQGNFALYGTQTHSPPQKKSKAVKKRKGTTKSKSQSPEQDAEPQEGQTQDTAESVEAGDAEFETLEDFVAQQSDGEEGCQSPLVVRLPLSQAGSSGIGPPSMTTSSLAVAGVTSTAGDTADAPSSASNVAALAEAEATLSDARRNDAPQATQGASVPLDTKDDGEKTIGDSELGDDVEEAGEDDKGL